ncbi:GNAT family N-acetyltransferase, partial [Cellulomonas hominis]|nr:GNAT family N-acetyltransferase [Cellulomonas hominis]
LLTRTALASAAAAGARRAFLQVEVANDGAAHLYAGEGFRPAERYGYRQR